MNADECTRQPQVTIGLVVHNGQKHLAAAINSLLAQTFADFEIVAYDNASTDQTPAILHRAAWNDDRVRIVRHAQNIGPLANFIHAAEHATTKYFCWATHDDLHDPRFLEVLINLMEVHPEAGLACCAVRNMDPDGTLRDLRTETLSLVTTTGMAASQRSLLHLRDAAGTPFYGVYRTAALHRALPALREIASFDGPAMLGLDMAFIAAFVKDHHLAVTHEPLLLFRRGGWSHRLDTYNTLRGYVRQLLRFDRSLAKATRIASSSWTEHIRLWIARRRFVCRYVLSAPMRRMTWHYLTASIPSLARARARIAVWMNPAYRRLRSRIRGLPLGSRIALYGAGKHTRRCLPMLRAAAGSRATIVGVCDDSPNECASIANLRIVGPDDLAQLGPAIVIVSSDAYEATLIDRAKTFVPDHIPIWCIYDPALEHSESDRSSDSTASMKFVNSSIASTEVLDIARSGKAA